VNRKSENFKALSIKLELKCIQISYTELRARESVTCNSISSSSIYEERFVRLVFITSDYGAKVSWREAGLKKTGR
jgi:hypothetical protein